MPLLDSETSDCGTQSVLCSDLVQEKLECSGWCVCMCGRKVPSDSGYFLTMPDRSVHYHMDFIILVLFYPSDKTERELTEGHCRHSGVGYLGHDCSLPDSDSLRAYT